MGEGTKNKVYYLKTLVRVFKEIKKYKLKRIYLFYLITSIAGGVLPILSYYIPKFIIQKLLIDELPLQIIIYVSLISFLLYLLNTIFSNLIGVYSLKIRLNKFEDALTVFHDVDYIYVEDPKFLDYVQTSITALNSEEVGFEGTFYNLKLLLPLLITFSLTCIILYNLNFLVFLSLLATGVFSFINNFLVGKYKYKKRLEESRLERKLDYYNKTSSDFTYGKDLRINNLSATLLDKHLIQINEKKQFKKKIYNYSFKISLIGLLFLLLQGGTGYYFVLREYFYENLGLEDVVFYLTAITSLSLITTSIGFRLSKTIEDLRITSTYYNFVDDLPNYNQKRGNYKSDLDDFEVILNHVSFKYPRSDNYIIKDLSLKISSKEKLAIVGVNGAGKTTLLKLILGLLVPEEGEILINGRSILDYDIVELSKKIGVVFQDVNLYAIDILSNIVGNDISDISLEKAKYSAKLTGLDEKIESFKNGYHENMLKVIYEDGIELSGGEIQKLAIARALVKDNSLVVLDEPTSSLDALAEGKIYEDFDKITKNKTTIFISHRLSSTKFCDHIVLIGNASILEYGTHNELMNLKGKYYEMFNIQGKYYKEENL
ncbi:MAG: ABC transporter ATP-binding protein/permease [Acholeplasmatales bacterium]|nr:ABC transporter ATP-binding protein/permease [Acholeplasmatales bacterium]